MPNRYTTFYASRETWAKEHPISSSLIDIIGAIIAVTIVGLMLTSIGYYFYLGFKILAEIL